MKLLTMICSENQAKCELEMKWLASIYNYFETICLSVFNYPNLVIDTNYKYNK